MSKSESLINCNTCKIRKVKCNRELPTCNYCSEHALICIYSNKIRRKGVSVAGLAPFINKIKASSSIKYCELTFKGYKINEFQEHEFALFQPILQPKDFADDNSQGIITKIQSNNTQFQTHIILLLSTQIIDHDNKLMPQIDFFVDKLEIGLFGKLLKFNIRMDQGWIMELLSPSFEEKCNTSYFQTFHPMAAYISKYKFYNNSSETCPVLKSVIILAGYSNTSKQSPELLKYLKHVAIVQLKKNMFNVRVSICQALFIFSCYLLFQGLGKQSLEYFHQACLMASALGIHLDMPGLNGVDKDERRCIRFISYHHDSYLSSIISIRPNYLLLAPIWAQSNPNHQINPHSKNPNEFLIAECICLLIKCFNMYWSIPTNLMNKYSQLTLVNPRASLIKNYSQLVYILQSLFNHALIQTLDSYLRLSGKCKNTEELEIVKSFAKIYVGLYYIRIIILNSQLSPENPTLELDQSTKKLLWSAQGLFQNSVDVGSFCISRCYQDLCIVSLLYIKLILVYNHLPQVKELLLEKLKRVYELFGSYRSKYGMPNDLIELVSIMSHYFNIKVKQI